MSFQKMCISPRNQHMSFRVLSEKAFYILLYLKKPMPIRPPITEKTILTTHPYSGLLSINSKKQNKWILL